MPDNPAREQRMFRLKPETIAAFQARFKESWIDHAAAECVARAGIRQANLMIKVCTGSHVDLPKRCEEAGKRIIVVHFDGRDFFEVWGWLPPGEAQQLARQFNGKVGLSFFHSMRSF